jgi:hypothetical protein
MAEASRTVRPERRRETPKSKGPGGIFDFACCAGVARPELAEGLDANGICHAEREPVFQSSPAGSLMAQKWRNRDLLSREKSGAHGASESR